MITPTGKRHPGEVVFLPTLHAPRFRLRPSLRCIGTIPGEYGWRENCPADATFCVGLAAVCAAHAFSIPMLFGAGDDGAVCVDLSATERHNQGNLR